MAKHFRCTIVTPAEQVLDEEVTYATVPAWDGQVGLLHQRSAMLVKLGDGAMRLDFAEGGSRWFFVGGGFAQMRDDQLSILTDEAMPVEEILTHDAQKALAEALSRTAITDDEVFQRDRDVTRARTMIQLSQQLKGRI